MVATLPPQLSTDEWLRQLFRAQAAADGGILRRKVADVERLVGRPRFLAAVERRGFHVVENAGQFLIFCNQEPVVILR